MNIGGSWIAEREEVAATEVQAMTRLRSRLPFVTG